jgi:ferredoxin
MDEDNCMVDVAKFYMEFIRDESCGKCTPCRVGTKRLLEILTKITNGQGELSDLDDLEELANSIASGALCGLGQTAGNPVLSTLRKFRKVYEEHVVDKKCRAGVCKKLIDFKIDPEKCKKCSMCARNCPVNAITGVVGKEPYVIDTKKCIKCGTCVTVCRFGAVSKE